MTSNMSTFDSPLEVNPPSGASATGAPVLPAHERPHPPAPQAATAPVPFLRIRPPSGWAAIDFGEIWLFRDLLLTLAARDIKLRYKQTILGAAWVIIQPLMAAGIFTFVFGLLADMPSGSVPYFVFAFAGMLAWQSFSQTLNTTSGCLVGNSHLISKVYFPRMVLPLSTVFSVMIDLAIGLGMMAILLWVFGIVPGWGIMLLPVWLGLLFMMALGFGLFSAALMVSYRDVRYVLPVLVQFLMYASPVGYGLAALHERLPASAPQWLYTVYMLNPLASLLEAFRWSILGEGQLHPAWLAYSAGCAVLSFLFAAFFFKRMERRFADVI
jgi:lipopolysaccharide transport system permease protein